MVIPPDMAKNPSFVNDFFISNFSVYFKPQSVTLVRVIQTIDRKDLILGAILGLALGDALGVPLHGIPKLKQSLDPISDLMGGGAFKLKPGEWTAETSMAMCVAESLLKCGTLNPEHLMETYLSWFEHGFWSCRDFSFGVDESLRFMLTAYRQGELTPKPLKPSVETGSVLVRLAPLAIAYLGDRESLQIRVAQVTRLTHLQQRSIDAARYFAALIQGALLGEDKDCLLAPDYSPVGCEFAGAGSLHPEIEAIRLGDYRDRPDFALHMPMDLPETLRASLWAFAKGTHFKDGLLKAVNLGGKSSIVGALYGQLAGAYYGADHIPDNWLRKLVHRNALEQLAERLWKQSLVA